MKKTKIVLIAILLVAGTWVAKSQGFKSLLIPCTVKAPVCDTNPLNNCEYICNGSFETYSATIYAPSQLPWANGWTSPTWGTPDLFCATSTVAAVQIPCNGLGYQASRTGTNSQVYAGIYTSGDAGNTYAEYLQTQLKYFLEPSNIYEVSFWISRADFQPTDNDRLDVFITENQTCINGGTGNPPSFEYANTYTAGSAPTPVYNVPTASLNDATNWVEVKFIYCSNPAGHEETNLIIGSYSGTSTTNVTPPTYVGSCSLTTASTDPNSAYYCYGPAYLYVDDVSMKRITSTVAFSPDNRCQNTPINFTITPISCFTPPSNYYIWDYGDGTTPAPGNLTSTHSYTAAGVYTVTVSYNVPSAIGCTPTHTMLVTVRDCCFNPNANNITLHDVNLVPNGFGGGATTWASLSSGNTYTGNIEVPAPVSGTSVLTKTLTIVGGFSINAAVTFSNCNIAFNHTVAMQQFSTSIIDHSYLWGCDKLWKGIESSAGITITNSWIEDAYIALVFGVTNHPGVNIDNVLFNKNYSGVLAFGGTMNPSDLSVTGSIFSSRNFGTANYLTTTRYTSLFPNIPAKVPGKIKGSPVYGITANTIRSHIGVYLYALTSNTTTNYFTIGAVPSSTLVANSDLTNYFDYLNSGIYNYESKVSVINNRFANMITTGTGTALGAVVHADASNPSVTKTEVGRSGSSNYRNYFGYPVYSSSLLDGVVASGGGTLSVSYNDFKTISRYGVSVSSWYAGTAADEPVTVASNSYSNAAYAFYGYDNNSIEASVETNTVVHTASTYTAYTNVYLDEINKPTTAVYHVHDNVFTGSLKGVYALNTKGTRIINNDITINKPGTGVFNADITLDNSDLCVVAQNTLDCSPTNSGSWYTFGILSNASASTTIKCNTISKVGNCLKFQYTCPNSTIFKNTLNNTGGTDACLLGLYLLSCSSIGDVGFPTGGGYGHSDDIWGDFSTADTYCEASSNYTPTIGKIYYDGGASAALYQPQVNLNTFNLFTGDLSKSYVPTTTTTANTDACNEAARMINIPSGGGKNVTGNIGEINTVSGISHSNSETVSNYQAGDLSKDRKRILMANDNKSSQRSGSSNEDRFYEVDSLFMVYAHTKNLSALNSAKGINSAVSAANTVEQNQKDFNAIHATYLEDDSLVTAGQIQDLITIAKLCPGTDGLAVYQARGLIRNWDDSTEYFNECERTIPDIANPEVYQRLLSNTKNNPVSAKPINLYPNPSNGKLMVENSPENSTFELYDIVGRKVYTNTLNGIVTQLDLSSFNNGTYLYKITQNGKPVKEDKLIINK
jgi:hypothetical protein